MRKIFDPTGAVRHETSSTRRTGRDAACRPLLAVLLVMMAAPVASAANPETDPSSWVGAWSTAPYGPYPHGFFPEVASPYFPGDQATDQSFRMIIRPTLGAEVIRVRLSNLMGDRPVMFDGVRVGKRAGRSGPALVPGTDHAVLFGGSPSVTVAAGEEAVSDATALSYQFGEQLAVSFHVVGDSGPMTWHSVAFALSYVGIPHGGNTTDDVSGASFVGATIAWFFLSGIDVMAAPNAGAIVALGDSITDGAIAVPETDTRWPDWLAERLHAAALDHGVLNQGINGNTVTHPNEAWAGPTAIDRFDRDVLDRAGIRSVVLVEGTNDLASNATAEEVYAALTDLARRARARGVCVVVATITPRADVAGLYGWRPSTMEPERERLNELIRNSSEFDGIADFDVAMRSPSDARRLHPLYDSGDGLHPNSIGFRAMADAVPLAPLLQPPAGTCQAGAA